MDIHIRKQIKKQVNILGMSGSDLARKLNYTSSNVYLIFQKKSIDTDNLQKISKVLNYDFFSLYTFKEKENKQNEFNLNINVTIKKLKN